MLREWIRNLKRRLGGGDRTGAGVGAMGEAAAATHLQRELGFTVLRRNWRHGRDEIDLICRDGEALVFVEVKTRAAHALVGGYQAVNRRKKRALLRASRAYLAQLVERPLTIRFDIVEIEHVDGARTALRHHANVPLFPKELRPRR